MLENYWKILTVTLMTFLWAEELDRLARSQTLFLESAGAPSPPVTTGTTAAFTLHIFSSSSFSLQYFSSFTCSFFQMLLAVTWDCYIYHHCLLLMVLYLVPQGLGFDILHLLRCLPFWPWGFQPIHRCSCTLCQPHGYGAPCTLCLPVSYSLLLCAAWSQLHICTACIWVW